MYTGVLHVHGCATCTRVCCMYTGVLHVHGCAACTRVCCMYTVVLHVHGCAACTRVCCMYTGVLHVRGCAACTRVCCMYTGVTLHPSRDYLFNCLNKREDVQNRAYGTDHLAMCVEDKDGTPMFVFDLDTGKDSSKILKPVQVS